MLPNWVSNPVPLTYESGALPIVLRGPAQRDEEKALTACRNDTFHIILAHVENS